MKKEILPEWICLGGSFSFLIIAILDIILIHPTILINFLMPFGFGLFLFLLSLIMNLLMRVERLEKKNSVKTSSKESTT